MPSRFLNYLADFDLDTHLNPYIPPPTILKLLPRRISHFLGYRQTPNRRVPASLVHLWSFIGTFCSISLICGVFMTAPALAHHSPPSPIIIGSFGASAILLFQTIDSPLSQPRNFILGHAIAAIIGVSITKLFRLNPDFHDLRWLAASLSCSIVSVVMGVTKTIHPPAGATAVLVSADAAITALGWWIIPCILISCCLMLGAALVINNLHRHYPAYWWSPASVGQRVFPPSTSATATAEHVGRDSLARRKNHVVTPALRPTPSSRKEYDPEFEIAAFAGEANPDIRDVDLESGNGSASDQTESEPGEQKQGKEREGTSTIVVTAERLEVPEDLPLAEEEAATLRLLQERLRRAHAGRVSILEKSDLCSQV